MRCFLSTTNINEIGLYAIGLEVFFHHLVPHINLKYFNVQKNVLCVEKLVVGQVILLNKSITTQKRSLVTAAPNIRYDQVKSKTFNNGLQNIKMLIMMKT